jgi:hypothetical protein
MPIQEGWKLLLASSSHFMSLRSKPLWQGWPWRRCLYLTKDEDEFSRTEGFKFHE